MKDPVIADLNRHLAETEDDDAREETLREIMEERGLDRHEAEGVLYDMEFQARLNWQLDREEDRKNDWY